MGKSLKGKLFILNGPDKGMSHDITTPYHIGRTEPNDLIIKDTRISRKHAEIVFEEGDLLIKDLDSVNGTFLNGKQISTSKLADLDKIQLGKIKLRFSSDEFPKRKDLLGEKVFLSDQVEATNVSINLQALQATLKPSGKKALSHTDASGIYNRYDTLIHTLEMITGTLDLNKILSKVAKQIFSVIKADRMAILLLDDKDNLKPVACLTKEGALPEGEGIRISKTIANRALHDKEAILCQDALGDERFSEMVSVVEMGIVSAMCAPLIFFDKTMGLIYLDSMGTISSFNEDDLRMLSVISRSIAIAIHNAQSMEEIKQKKEEIKRAYVDTTTTLMNTIEARDHYTAGHTWRVTQFSVAIAKELGWPHEEIEELRMGALLHDIGKISIEDSILRKPDKLTDDEFEKMKFHPKKGEQILKDIHVLKSVLKDILSHHERWDGKGYANGLDGEKIPIGGRIIAVADTFDALTSDRPYRKGMQPEKAIRIIKEVTGTQLDPKIADTFLRVWEKGKIKNIMQKYNIRSSSSTICSFCSTWIDVPKESKVNETFQCAVCQKKLQIVEKGKKIVVELA